jgi:hypothetical protein
MRGFHILMFLQSLKDELLNTLHYYVLNPPNIIFLKQPTLTRVLEVK